MGGREYVSGSDSAYSAIVGARPLSPFPVTLTGKDSPCRFTPPESRNRAGRTGAFAPTRVPRQIFESALRPGDPIPGPRIAQQLTSLPTEEHYLAAGRVV